MGIDINKLKQFVGNDEAFIASLMDKFIEEIPKELVRLKEFSTQHDWIKVRAVAHKMLSSTKIFGLDQLTYALQYIEQFAESEINLERIPALLDELDSSSKTVLKEIKLQREKLRN